IAQRASSLGELAVVVRDCGRMLGRGDRYQLFVRGNRLLPVALLLVDANQIAQRRLALRAFVRQLLEQRLRAIEQAGAEVILGERESRVSAMLVAQRTARDDVFVHANRTLDLAATPIQTPQREMRF